MLKSFIEGANICDKKKESGNFFYLKLNKENSKVFYFENNSLKFEQNFKFGTNIIVKDISKITSLKPDSVMEIIKNVDLNEELLEDDLIENSYLINEPNKKIKKKLIYEIIKARLKEISMITIFKNINFHHNHLVTKNIYLEINSQIQSNCLDKIYLKIFSFNGDTSNTFLQNVSDESLMTTANKLVHFGWKKEAIPLSNERKSIVARFFDALFG